MSRRYCLGWSFYPSVDELKEASEERFSRHQMVLKGVLSFRAEEDGGYTIFSPPPDLNFPFSRKRGIDLQS